MLKFGQPLFNRQTCGNVPVPTLENFICNVWVVVSAVRLAALEFFNKVIPHFEICSQTGAIIWICEALAQAQEDLQESLFCEQKESSDILERVMSASKMKQTTMLIVNNKTSLVPPLICLITRDLPSQILDECH